MEELIDIVGRRSTPAILILDRQDKLLFCNQEALDMFPQIRQARKGTRPPLPPEIFDLCEKLREEGKLRRSVTCKGILEGPSHFPYSVRVFFLGRQKQREPTHVVVLVEKIAAKHAIDFEKVKEQFLLSPRELQVLMFLCQGLSNKDIARELCISEYTAKDHIKKIMSKLSMTSRSQIISFLNR